MTASDLTSSRCLAPSRRSTVAEQSARRPKVLVSAFACNPFRGSEDAVGWGWARMAAQHNDVHVLTAEFQRAPLAEYLSEFPDAAQRLTFHFVPRRRWHYRPTRLWRAVEVGPLKPIMNLSYAAWLRDAARYAEVLDRQHDFDLVHLVTYVGYRFPGLFYRMAKPFAWGPIGGTQNIPWRFLPSLGVVGGPYHALRNAVNILQRRLLSARRAMRRAGPGLIAATAEVARDLRRHFGCHCLVMSEVGLDAILVDRPTSRRPGEPLRIVWSGEHLPGKGLQFLLKALAKISPVCLWELTVLGDGPSRGRWQRLAMRLGLNSRVTWKGWLSRRDALAQLRCHHLLTVTSVKDLTSTVLVEALASGLPVVYPDLCGFAGAVGPEAGIRVRAGSPRGLANGIAEAVARLARDEPERVRKAWAALNRVRQFLWSEKTPRLESVYRAVLRAGGHAR